MEGGVKLRTSLGWFSTMVSQRHLPPYFLGHFSPVLRRLFAVLLRFPASWRQDGENGRKMAENGRNLGENGRETAVAQWRWAPECRAGRDGGRRQRGNHSRRPRDDGSFASDYGRRKSDRLLDFVCAGTRSPQSLALRSRPPFTSPLVSSSASSAGFAPALCRAGSTCRATHLRLSSSSNIRRCWRPAAGQRFSAVSSCTLWPRPRV